jgi:hypothetical protein
VGVQRQYSGTAGKVDNCQLGVFLAYASVKGDPAPRRFLEDLDLSYVVAVKCTAGVGPQRSSTTDRTGANEDYGSDDAGASGDPDRGVWSGP